MVLESGNGRRNKKLIWALETREQHGRPTCSECTDKLKARRGCKKPGFDMTGTDVYRSSSPALQPREDKDQSVGPHILRECPVGMILRETPYIYEAIQLQSYAENGAFNPLDVSHWLQSIFQVVSSEKARNYQLHLDAQRSTSDSKIGAASLKARTL